MLKTILSALTLSLMCVLSSHAAEKIKAGLWQITTQSAAMKSMPKIPPEQIEQMRKMGVDVAQLQSGVIVSKMCITKEMAERDQLPQIDQAQGGCKLGNTQRQENGYTSDIVCDSPQLKGKGVSKATFTSNESFSSSSEFKGTVNGQPVNDRSDISGKWIAADCGSVKPIPDGQKKK